MTPKIRKKEEPFREWRGSFWGVWRVLRRSRAGRRPGGAKRRRSGPEVRQPAGTAGGLRPVTGGLLEFAEKGAEPLPVRAEAFGQVARGGFPEPGPGSLTRRKAGKKDDAVPSVSEA